MTSELTVLMAAVLIGGTMMLATINEGVSHLAENMFHQVGLTDQAPDFSAKFIKVGQ